MPETNILPFLEHLQVKDVKSFKILSAGVMFVDKDRSLPEWRCCDKCYSLLGFFIGEGGKSFFNIDNICQFNKAFFILTDG